MKIIAVVDHDNFLAQINRRELEKHQNRYHSSQPHLEIKIGTELNLGCGFDFSSDIKNNLDKVQALITSSQPVVNAIINGLRIANCKDDNNYSMEKFTQDLKDAGWRDSADAQWKGIEKLYNRLFGE